MHAMSCGNAIIENKLEIIMKIEIIKAASPFFLLVCWVSELLVSYIAYNNNVSLPIPSLRSHDNLLTPKAKRSEPKKRKSSRVKQTICICKLIFLHGINVVFICSNCCCCLYSCCSHVCMFCLSLLLTLSGACSINYLNCRK